jgi:hypothetical protein
VELQRRNRHQRARRQLCGDKQYIAVLVGSAMRAQVLANAPEMRNNATASMLFVFTL